MKKILILCAFLSSAALMADTVLETCSMQGSKMTIAKIKNKLVVYENEDRAHAKEIADFEELSKSQAMENEIVVGVAEQYGLNMANVSKVMAYVIVQDDDGGLTLLSYYSSQGLIKAFLVSMGGGFPCDE